MTDRRKLEARLERRIAVDPVTGCWLWTGVRLRSGYGRISYRGRYWLVHRLTYTLARGPIPGGLVLDHLCRNRSCVHPNHLQAVTQTENMRRIPYPRQGCTLAIRGRLYIQVKAADGKHRQRSLRMKDTPENRAIADKIRAEVVAGLISVPC